MQEEVKILLEKMKELEQKYIHLWEQTSETLTKFNSLNSSDLEFAGAITDKDFIRVNAIGGSMAQALNDISHTVALLEAIDNKND